MKEDIKQLINTLVYQGGFSPDIQDDVSYHVDYDIIPESMKEDFSAFLHEHKQKVDKQGMVSAFWVWEFLITLIEIGLEK